MYIVVGEPVDEHERAIKLRRVGDAGGAIKMIAEVKSDFAVKVGDLCEW